MFAEAIHRITSLRESTFYFRIHMMGAFAEFERDLIIERTADGLASARARGRVGGRPKGLSPAAKQKASIASALYKEGMVTTQVIKHVK